MRILHLADLHLGMVTHSRPDPATGLPSRLLDVARCWHRAAEIAVERAVDAVILAGDVFHGPNPDAAALMLFETGLRVLQEAEIPVVMIAGNHDRAPHPNQSCVLELFDERPRVFAVTRPEIVDAGGILVACLPSVSRHQLMASRPELSRAGAEEAIVEGLRQILDDFRAREVDVLTGHWSVQGTILGGERDIAIIPEPMLPMADLEGPWSYAAFGHIHKTQPFTRPGGRIFGAYAGSIDRMNFGEEGEEKLALEVELHNSGGVAEILELHELPARKFVTLDWSYWQELGLSPFELADEIAGAIVRVQAEVSEEESRRLDLAAVRASLLDAGAHQAHVELTVHRSARPRAEQVAKASSPLDALEGFLDAREVDEQHRPPIRQSAKELLEASAP